MENIYFFLVSICVLTHVIRTLYEILKDQKKIKASKFTFAAMFINMFLLWISWFVLCSLDIYKINLAPIVRYFGISLFFSGVIIFAIALFTIKTLEDYKGELVTKGIYSKVRHPMYLGFIFWLIGVPIFFGAVFSFALSFLFIANVLFWEHIEEKELVKRFSSYREYKKSTIF